MEPSIDTTDVREPRPFKINAYVHPDRAAYLTTIGADGWPVDDNYPTIRVEKI